MTDPFAHDKEAIHRMEQESTQRMMQKLHRYSEYETMIQHRAGTAVRSFLWKRSPATFHLYIIPTILFMFSYVALGLAHTAAEMKPPVEWIRNIGYGLCALLLLSIPCTMIYHTLRRTFGLVRIISIAQIVVALIFTAWAYLTELPDAATADDKSAHRTTALYFIGLMTFLFFATLITDLVNGYRRRGPSME